MSVLNYLLSGSGSSSINGVVIGVVSNTEDPDKLGRIKVKFPWLSPEAESTWARVVSLFAGKEKGIVFFPEIDDEVLIAFQNGNINMPFVIGSLWNGVDAPPETNEDGKGDIKMIKTRAGHTIKFSDKEGEEKIEIIDSSEANSFTIDAKENKISIVSKQDIELSAPEGKVSIQAKEFEMKTDANLVLEAGADFEIKSGANVNVKGSMINLN